MQPSTFYQHNSTTDVDARLVDICKTARCSYRPNYDAVTTMHAKRQLFSEFQVGTFLQQHQTDYAAAVVIGSDIYVPRPLSPADIERVIQRKSGVEILTTNNNNGAGGVTNGFYVGNPKAISSVMMRLTDAGNFPEVADYEHQLRRAFDRHRIKPQFLQNFGWMLQSFAKLRYSPGINRQEGSAGLYWPDPVYVNAYAVGPRPPSPMVVDSLTIECLKKPLPGS